MTSLVHFRFHWQPGLLLALAAAVRPAPAQEVKQGVLSVPKAEAATESQMQAYTEIISGTESAFEMVPIPGGKFLWGSPEGEVGRKPDEGPQVEVQIEPFWMGKHEVTWDLYEMWSFKLDVQRRTFTGTKPNELDKLADVVTRPTAPYTDMTFGMGKENYPAICMTQLAAKKYCEWLSAKTGRYYRLPTEAEWEYACRAGTKTAYSFGDDASKLGDYAWYFDNADEAYHKVGLKKPNPWGLHDMHGNVAEHVLDRYDPVFYQQLKAAGASLKTPYNRPNALENRAVKGGSWDDDPEALRSAARRGSHADWKIQDPQIPQSQWYYTDALFCGFRVVRPLREPTTEEKASFAPDKIQVYKEK
jgi:formylglycine-generating enzyme required for sulfatase activity